MRRNPGVLRLDLSSVTYAAKLRFLAEELWGEETLQSGAGQQRQQQGVQLQLQLQLQQQVGEAPAGEAEEAGDGLSSSAGGSDIGSWQEALIAHPFYISYRLDRIASRGCYLKVGGTCICTCAGWLTRLYGCLCSVLASPGSGGGLDSDRPTHRLPPPPTRSYAAALRCSTVGCPRTSSPPGWPAPRKASAGALGGAP